MMYDVEFLNCDSSVPAFFFGSSDPKEAIEAAAIMWPDGDVLVYRNSESRPFGSAKNGIVLAA